MLSASCGYTDLRGLKNIFERKLGLYFKNKKTDIVLKNHTSTSVKFWIKYSYMQADNREITCQDIMLTTVYSDMVFIDFLHFCLLDQQFHSLELIFFSPNPLSHRYNSQELI